MKVTGPVSDSCTCMEHSVPPVCSAMRSVCGRDPSVWASIWACIMGGRVGQGVCAGRV
jgi:hypothetical protein